VSRRPVIIITETDDGFTAIEEEWIPGCPVGHGESPKDAVWSLIQLLSAMEEAREATRQ
jgi:hypothetical protein